MSALSTVLISASTSAAVALVIEWAAKPGLEARKERILERYRAQREIARQLRTIIMNIGTLDSNVQASDAAGQEIVMRFQRERREAILEAGCRMSDAIIDAGIGMNDNVRGLVSNVAGITQAINPSDSDYKPPEHVKFIAGFCLDLYMTPRWRIRRRKMKLDQARQLVEAMAADSQSSSEPSGP